MKTVTISRENNFDFLRLLFASLVIVSHSFPLTGVRQLEPLRVISNGQLDLGGFAVKCFFILSGFLIFQSLERSSSLLNYLWKRVLRLFPGLFFMLLFVLLVVPFVYTGEMPLLENKSYLTYLPRQMMLYNLQDSIDGVFVGMPYSTVNGSLWTICYEFTMYLMIGLFFFVKKNWRLPFLVVLFILFYSIPTFYHPEFLKNYFSKIYLHSPNVYVLGSYFMAGAILSYFAQKIKNNRGGVFFINECCNALFGGLFWILRCCCSCIIACVGYFSRNFSYPLYQQTRKIPWRYFLRSIYLRLVCSANAYPYFWFQCLRTYHSEFTCFGAPRLVVMALGREKST